MKRYNAVADLSHELQIVSDNNNSRALSGGPAQILAHAVHVFAVKAAGGFVKKNNVGPTYHGRRHTEPLLFTTGKRLGMPVRQRSQAIDGQKILGSGFDFVAWQPHKRIHELRAHAVHTQLMVGILQHQAHMPRPPA